MKEYNDDFTYIAERLDKELNATKSIALKLLDGKESCESMETVIKDKAFEIFVKEHKKTILDRLYTYLGPVFQEFAKLGYGVTRYGNTVFLSNRSPAGEEIDVPVYLDSEDEITLQLFKLYDSFDEDDHIYMLLEAKKNGFEGVPCIRELVDDTVAISDMYKQLYDAAHKARTLCKD